MRFPARFRLPAKTHAESVGDWFRQRASRIGPIWGTLALVSVFFVVWLVLDYEASPRPTLPPGHGVAPTPNPGSGSYVNLTPSPLLGPNQTIVRPRPSQVLKNGAGHGPNVRLYVTLQSLDRKTGALTFGLQLAWSAKFRKQLVDVTDPQRFIPVADQPTFGPLALKKKYRARSVTMIVTHFFDVPGATYRIRLSRFFTKPSNYGGFSPVVWSSQLVEQTIGHPQAFPGDWYWLSMNVEVVLPPGLGLEGVAGGVNADPLPRQVPLSVWVTALPTLEGNSVRASGSYPYGNNNLSNPTIDFMVESNFRGKLFSYAAAVLPLAIIFIVAYASGKRRRKQSARNPIDSIALAAALLAVFPIHAVAVPQDITAVTRVDILLLWGVFAGLALFAVLVLTDLRESPNSR